MTDYVLVVLMVVAAAVPGLVYHHIRLARRVSDLERVVR